MSALSDLLQANLPEGWSYRRVGREARERGFPISDATATAYLGGRHGSPDEQTIEGFSVVLHIPLRKLRTAAGLNPEPGTPWVPPVESRHLDSDQRQVLSQLVKVMARERKAGDGDGDATPTKTGPSGPAPTDLSAARAARDAEVQRIADEVVANPEKHAALPMPEGGTEYMKRVRQQDEAAEAGDVTPEEEG